LDFGLAFGRPFAFPLLLALAFAFLAFQDCTTHEHQQILIHHEPEQLLYKPTKKPSSLMQQPRNFFSWTFSWYQCIHEGFHEVTALSQGSNVASRSVFPPTPPLVLSKCSGLMVPK